MIKNIIRIVLLAVIVIGLAWGVSWLIQNGGEVPMQIRGKEYRPTAMGVVVVIAAGLVVFWLFIKLVELLLALVAFILGDKNAFSRFLGRRRARRGMDALELSVVALAAGDSKTAFAKAQRANKDLDRPVLTNLLVARAAKAEGKTKAVEEAYKNILKTGTGRFVATRGLMEERAAIGDDETARKLGQKALEMNPNDLPTINMLFDLQLKDRDWEGARQTLKVKVKAEKMPADVARRREAVIAISEAKTMNPAEDQTAYDEIVTQAYRLAPNLVPGAVMAAKMHAKAGNMRAADSTIVKAWNSNPHPDLAEAYASLVPNETPEARLRRFKVLTKRQKDNPETKMLSAELLIAAEDFPGARRAMKELASNPETARQLAIMAAIEHGEGADDTIVRAYLARAMKASRGPQWVCGNCGYIHGEWQAICSDCGQFDTLDWKSPTESIDQDSGIGVLLPLLMSSSQMDAVVDAEEKLEEDAVIDGEKA